MRMDAEEFHSLVLDPLEGWSCSAPSCDWYVIDIANEEIVRSIWSDEHTHGEEETDGSA